MKLKTALDVLAAPILKILFWHDNRYRTNEISERPTEYAYALKKLGQHNASTVLDIGPGRSSFPHLLWYCGYKVTAIDPARQYWGAREQNRHYPVIDADITDSVVGRFDAVISISTIEHIKNIRDALKNIYMSIDEDGVFICTMPISVNWLRPMLLARTANISRHGSSMPHRRPPKGS